MKFSTKSRYALRLMAELARYAPGTTVSLKEISERQNLSLKYLEQIVNPLARMGLVKSERGSQGGYRLTKTPADYTAGEILRAIEGSVAPIPCLGSETNECPMSEQCFTLPFWSGLDDVINQYIDSVTLEQLAQSLPSANEGCGGCGQGLRPHKKSLTGIDEPRKKRYTIVVFPPGCCAVGSAPALGAGGREFESRHSDKET